MKVFYRKSTAASFLLIAMSVPGGGASAIAYNPPSSRCVSRFFRTCAVCGSFPSFIDDQDDLTLDEINATRTSENLNTNTASSTANDASSKGRGTAPNLRRALTTFSKPAGDETHDRQPAGTGEAPEKRGQ